MEKRSFKTKYVVIIVVLIIFLVLGFSLFFYIKKSEEKKAYEEHILALVKDIKSHYNKYVKVDHDAKIYEKVNGKYKPCGKVSSGVYLTLLDTKINKDTKYFEIEGFSKFISYKDVSKVDKLNEVDDRYKSYILFNENVKSRDVVRLYKDDKVIYTLNYSIDLPIIIKYDDGVGVEFNNDLYKIKNEDILKTYEKVNSSDEVLSELPVSVYHFIYLHGEVCNEVICHSEDQIRSHFEYLRSNNYTTVTADEVLLWNEGKINLPRKSIMITIDDGARAEKFIPFLEQYKIHATLFLITSWYPTSKFTSDYLDIQSHSDNLHIPGVCSGGQGSPLKCTPTEELVRDLKISRDKTGAIAFCFPFYEFNDHAIDAVKQAGFSMAFIGGQRKMKRGGDLYKIPRISFQGSDSLEYYISMIS